MSFYFYWKGATSPGWLPKFPISKLRDMQKTANKRKPDEAEKYVDSMRRKVKRQHEHNKQMA